MDWPLAVALIVGALGLVLLAGEWIAMSLVVAGGVYLVISDGWDGLRPVGSISWNQGSSFVLTAVPLFLFMGEVVVVSGLSARLYRGATVMLAKVPGGLLHANILASGVLAAMSGSSVASSAAMTSVAMPEMDKANYSRRLAFTSLTGGGSLGQLIPPSLGALIFGAYAELSISKLFIAGILPGVLLMVLFSSYMALRVMRSPELAPSGDSAALDWRGKAAAVVGTAPAVILVFIVLGSIYFGVATPTEAAAVGAVGAVLVGAVFGRLSVRGLVQAATKSATLAAALIFIVVAAQVLSAAFVLSGATRGLTGAVASLDPSPAVFFVFLLLLYVLLGAFIDGISLILVTLPVMLPLIDTVGINPYVFGIMLMLFIELGQVTPPVGVDLFIIKGVADDASLQEIFQGAIPTALIILAVATAVFFVPDLFMWLPNQVGR